MGEKEGGGDGKANGGKKEEVSTSIVLKIDMHCEGCVKKITKSAKKFHGVENVLADTASNKLTVKGKISPVVLRELLEHKTKKKVEIISPLPGKKDGGDDKKKTDEKKAAGDDKKNKEPLELTVVLKIKLHCDGCIQRIRKIIRKYKGVTKVDIDTEKDLVTVKGTMDMKALQPYLKEKLKRGVEIVPPKKEEKKEEKKAEGDGSTEKKPAEKKGETNKMEQVTYVNGYGFEYVAANGYSVQYVHAPQIFSDENPNACSIM
ncbi:hypothetical protein ACHQM5_010085 [Ranunculus cassubicifolius]